MSDSTNSCPDDTRLPLRALIVGACGSAGQSFARALLPLGIEVIAVDQDEVGLARLRHELGCASFIMNALDDGDVAGLFELVEATFGRVDILINVAGRGYVRTLAMMRVSRAFSERPHDRSTYIVNVGRPSAPDEDIVTYAGSELAFDRLSHGLSETIANPKIRILTLPRLQSDDAYADMCERLCGELRRSAADFTRGTQSHANG